MLLLLLLRLLLLLLALLLLLLLLWLLLGLLLLVYCDSSGYDDRLDKPVGRGVGGSRCLRPRAIKHVQVFSLQQDLQRYYLHRWDACSCLKVPLLLFRGCCFSSVFNRFW
jgi:hypothetical protein